MTKICNLQEETSQIFHCSKVVVYVSVCYATYVHVYVCTNW